jgi:hypothetical protein
MLRLVGQFVCVGSSLSSMIDLAAETDSVVIDSAGEPRNSIPRSLHNESVGIQEKERRRPEAGAALLFTTLIELRDPR